MQHLGELIDIHADDNESRNDIDLSHERNHHDRELRDTGNAAKDNEAEKRDNKNRCDRGVQSEGVRKGARD